MKTELVEEHTIVDLPLCSGKVLDVGCRHFDFTKAMVRKGYQVMCLEADKMVVPCDDPNIHFVHGALVPHYQNRSHKTLITFGNGTANHLTDIGGGRPVDRQERLVIGLSILEMCSLFNNVIWDVVKLDCEGSEYNVLLDWPGVVARQITVEFHEHTNANTQGSNIYTQIIEHLSQWYEVVQHNLFYRHGIGTSNYWDSLFVLKPEFMECCK